MSRNGKGDDDRRNMRLYRSGWDKVDWSKKLKGKKAKEQPRDERNKEDRGAIL